jgi:hypothetical protein
VRLGETLSSKESQAGQTFSATLAQPVAAEGKAVIPSGATATGTVVAAHAAGKFKGASLLQIKRTPLLSAGGSTRLKLHRSHAPKKAKESAQLR